MIEEFIAVQRNPDQAIRLIDGVIVLWEETMIHSGRTYDIKDKDVVIIQTKGGRIGMYLLGQAYFSRLLIEKLQPKSVRIVAICGKGDKVIEQLAQDHGIEVVIIK